MSFRNLGPKPKTSTGGFTYTPAISNTVTVTDDIGNLTITDGGAQFIDLGQYVLMYGTFTFTTSGAVTQIQLKINNPPSQIDVTGSGQAGAIGSVVIRCGTSAATSVQASGIIVAGSASHLQIYVTLNTATSGASANTHWANWHCLYKKGF